MSSLKNCWVNFFKRKEIFEEIDEKVVDAWAEDKTVGDLIKSLSKEQKKVFYNLRILDCGLEKTEYIIDISIKLPDFEGY